MSCINVLVAREYLDKSRAMSLIHLSVKEIISIVGYPLSLSSKVSCYNNNVDKFMGQGQLASAVHKHAKIIPDLSSHSLIEWTHQACCPG